MLWFDDLCPIGRSVIKGAIRGEGQPVIKVATLVRQRWPVEIFAWKD
ncbi:hypothetical protein FLM9_1345 [Candidatus Synechococcus spongiarum]|uniref:Uncharacterized protein n=1 Tax=Candidatus Synechococcus spongiarum TaxID=431041 RepID=A0A171DHI9_9SYNE|nr:hypothetical protein FLM9_1345 [Candidatus Synechococcus spongiarum]